MLRYPSKGYSGGRWGRIFRKFYYNQSSCRRWEIMWFWHIQCNCAVYTENIAVFEMCSGVQWNFCIGNQYFVHNVFRMPSEILIIWTASFSPPERRGHVVGNSIMLFCKLLILKLVGQCGHSGSFPYQHWLQHSSSQNVPGQSQSPDPCLTNQKGFKIIAVQIKSSFHVSRIRQV